MFSCEFCEISRNTFSTEDLQTTASGSYTLRNVLFKKKRADSEFESHEDLIIAFAILNFSCLYILIIFLKIMNQATLYLTLYKV